jgi:hypothetical protein
MVLESVGCTGAGWGSWTAEDRIGVSGDLKGDHQVYRKEPDPAQEDGITNNHSDFANEVGTLQDVWKRAGGGGEAWSVGQPHLRVCVEGRLGTDHLWPLSGDEYRSGPNIKP